MISVLSNNLNFFETFWKWKEKVQRWESRLPCLTIRGCFIKWWLTAKISHYFKSFGCYKKPSWTEQEEESIKDWWQLLTEKIWDLCYDWSMSPVAAHHSWTAFREQYLQWLETQLRHLHMIFEKEKSHTKTCAWLCALVLISSRVLSATLWKRGEKTRVANYLDN